MYTPRFLAERVVATTLEAIVYSPGPLDTGDKSQWVLKTPEEILHLKVCDIAAGSGAFLVAATRYLAERLLESRRQHATDATALADSSGRRAAADADTPAVLGLRELAQAEQEQLDARRAVIVNCIYGVDINPMAIEMAKLSLWLTSLDRNRPFSFLDDHLAVGDSLLGITSPQQLIDLHFDPKKGRALHKDTLDLFTSSVESDLKSASELRAQIPLVGERDSRDAHIKQRLLRRAREVTQRLTLVADGLAAASLAGGKDGDYLTVASLVSDASQGRDADDQKLRLHIARLLRRQVGEGQHQPAHHPLLFPEVFSAGHTGFDAVIGNPPFLGGKKISGASGSDYRESLVRTRGRGIKGNADLVAYMLLTAAEVLHPEKGQVGLIATSTLAQGDTREVGLDQVTTDGLDIRAAVKSEKWPTQGANLDFSVIWGSRQPREPGVRAVADGTPVPAIAPSLDPTGRVTGNPYRLAANQSIAFIGSYVLGMGFTLTEERAYEMIAADPRNAEVVFPYVNGEDLASRPDSSGSRWIVNFFDWTEARARSYPGPWSHLEEHVKSERLMKDAVKYPKMVQQWWRYWNERVELHRAIEGLDHVYVVPRASYLLVGVKIPTRQVFHEKLVVFASQDDALLALLNSAFHRGWALSRMKGGGLPTYAPSDVFESLPIPEFTIRMRAAAEALHITRSDFMMERQMGLTKTYNLMHDQAVADARVVRLRDLHREIDEAVCEAYGWSDLELRHAHYETRRGVRWTVHLDVLSEMLDRLLELNHERKAAEVAAGMHGKGAKKVPAPAAEGEQTLFGDEA